MEETVGYAVCAAAGWAAFLHRAVDLPRRDRGPSTVALCTAMGLVAVAFTLAVPSAKAAVDQVTGVPNLGAFLIHLTAVSYGFAMRALVEFWAKPAVDAWPRVRWRLSVLASVGLTMTTLFLLAHLHRRSAHFLVDASGNPFVAAYGLLYVAALGAALIACTRTMWRYSSVAGLRWVRRGLRITVFGHVLGIAYCVTCLADIVRARTGPGSASWTVLLPVFLGGGLAASLCGLTMPNWGPRLSEAVRWLTRYRELWRLYPLWAAICRAVPEVALDPPRSRFSDRLTLGDLEFRLCRRVIEIRDGQLTLRPWRDPAPDAPGPPVPDAGGGLVGGGADEAAAAEALQLHRAIRAKVGNRPARPGADGGHAVTRGGAHLSGEIAWLTRVAAAFTRLADGGPTPPEAPGTALQHGARPPAHRPARPGQPGQPARPGRPGQPGRPPGG